MKLSELLAGQDHICPKPIDMDMEVDSVAYHSGKVGKNSLFVCIKGYKTDGHKYLRAAYEGGAKVAIVEEVQEEVPIAQIVVEDSRKALAALSCNFYSRPSEKMTMIGITATNGKTTTSFMLYEILKAKGYKTGLIGTVMIAIGEERIPSELTTPESLELQFYLSEMYKSGVTHVVMEVSSSALELSRVHGVDFDYVCFNNISREHIDLHGDFESYFRIKSSLVQKLKSSGCAVLNSDEAQIAQLKESSSSEILTYSVKDEEGDLFCKDLDLSTGRAKWTVCTKKDPEKSFDISLSVPGYHSVYNAMSAIAIALKMGIDTETIQRGLLAFRGVERRFQFIYEKDFTVIDDHYANAGNIDVTLSTLTKMKYNRLHLVYGIRGSRGVIVNSENAYTTLKWLDKLELDTFVATKSVSHVTEKDVVTKEEEEIFLKIMREGGREPILREELSDALDLVLSKVGKGDVILLAGCQVMDSAGRLILEKIADNSPEEERESIMEAVKDRVCGI
ncbi:MAG: UDP-N-acetylmuramyl-tripeptide synthetase [Filifactor alocis]|nr:UDP-N-acetylmuramyl-tripeptide synthetase [Filifactor alocis]